MPNYNLDARILLANLLRLENKYLVSDVKVANKDTETFFSMIKDRVNLTLYKLEKIVNGEGLDEFIDTLSEQDQVSKLAQLGGGKN